MSTELKAEVQTTLHTKSLWQLLWSDITPRVSRDLVLTQGTTLSFF